MNDRIGKLIIAGSAAVTYSACALVDVAGGHPVMWAQNLWFAAAVVIINVGLGLRR